MSPAAPRFRSRPCRARSTASTMSASETRERVADAVGELGYVPHAGARSLSLARTMRSASSCPTFTANSSPRSCAAWTARRAAAATCCSCPTCTPAASRRRMRCAAMRGRVDGLIVMAPHLAEDELAAALPRGLPAVLINTPRQRATGPRSISTMRGRARGRRPFCWRSAGSASSISPARGAISTRSERADGFREARASGTACELRSRAGRFRGGIAAKRRSRRCSSGGLTFDAIFAANDMMAIGALQALRDAAIDVPGRRRGRRLRRHSAGAHLGLTTVACGSPSSASARSSG